MIFTYFLLNIIKTKEFFKLLKQIQTYLTNQREPKTTLEITNVNIFVGPNSSGKSIFLKELNNYLTLSNYDFRKIIIQKLLKELTSSLLHLKINYDILIIWR